MKLRWQSYANFSAGPVSRKPLHRELLDEIISATVFLVEKGLADDQNYPFESQLGADTFVVQYPNTVPFSSMLKDQHYAETYREQLDARSYNIRMLDGALIQMVYELADGHLRRYRLAFLPSPDLLEFQRNPEMYLEEVLYADVVEKRAVTVPLRFDFDDRDGVASSVNHPTSHLTLGQYSGCRIAATAPITPYLFIEFLLRSFYNTAIHSISDQLPKGACRLESCITADEAALIHIGVPASV
jgi:hypothetical protein